jgi:hypothetical protein
VFDLDAAYVSHTCYKSGFSGCCICFTHMLQVFLSRCCISLCFTHMLEHYVSNVSSVSDVCCIQVFHGETVSDGHMVRAPGDGARQSWGPTNMGAASWGPTTRSRPCEEREEGSGGKSGTRKVHVRGRVGHAVVHPDTRRL